MCLPAVFLYEPESSRRTDQGEKKTVTVFNDRGCIEVVGRLRVPILIYGPSDGPPTRAV